MNRENMWNELTNLDKENIQQIINEDIEKNILMNPSKFVAYLDGLFLILSKNRMDYLSNYYKTEKLADSYFTMTSMKQAWKMIRMNLNGTVEEFRYASSFIEISEEKFYRNISMNEATQALDYLLKLTSIWYNDNNDTHNEKEEIYSEVSATIEQEVISDRPSVSEKGNNSFLKELDVLRTSSQESVVHSDTFGLLRKYMHVKRPIEVKFEQILQGIVTETEPQLILLCGSVGDGKSHLLSYINSEKPELFKDVYVHNDSTESFSPNENSIDTLSKLLSHFNEHDSTPRKHTVIAINLGVLQKFYTYQRERGQFRSLCNFIEDTGVFSDLTNVTVASGNFHMLNFSETQPYAITKEGTHSSFFMELIGKVTVKSDRNPFYAAWQADLDKGNRTIIHENYALLQNEGIKKTIVQILIEAMIKYKVFISTRSFYNFIYEILVPARSEIKSLETEYETGDMLPNLMFSHPERSSLLEAISKLDPVKRRTKELDKLNSEFIMSTSPTNFVKEIFPDEIMKTYWKDLDDTNINNQTQYSKLLIRQYLLVNGYSENKRFSEFIWYLYAYYNGDGGKLGELFNLIKIAVYKWKGSPCNDHIYISPLTDQYRLATKIEIEAIVDEAVFRSMQREEIDCFSPFLRIGFQQGEQKHLFELDYKLYVLLMKISEGYRPGWQELQDALQFSEFHDQLIKSADKTKELLIVHSENQETFRVKRQGVFEKTKYLVEKVI